ncbi:MAG: ATPase domain-containing protein [Candidatus Poseidoniaceae archaeon]
MSEHAPKPVEDGFPFGVETDSLADSMGLHLPNRSLYLIQGTVGSGKSLVSQRLVHGMLENGCKILVVTTELTTRGWIEQMESIGYGVTEPLTEGRLTVFSRYGTIAEPVPDVSLYDVFTSPAIEEADVIVLDTASSIMPELHNDAERVAMMQRLREVVSDGRSILLTVDPEETDGKALHMLRSSAELVLDMSTALIGGDIKRSLTVTRFLRAAGPVQTNIGWRVEPSMGFIVDITAVS